MRTRNKKFSIAFPLAEILANIKELWFLAITDTSSILLFVYTVMQILLLLLYLLTQVALPNQQFLKIVLKAWNF